MFWRTLVFPSSGWSVWEQGRRFLTEQVMEASHSNPEDIKEGPLYGNVTYSLLIQLSHIMALFRAFHHSLPRGVSYITLFSEENLPILSSPCQQPLHRQASPTFLLACMYLYPYYSLLLHLCPLPSTIHFPLKTKAARSS